MNPVARLMVVDTGANDRLAMITVLLFLLLLVNIFIFAAIFWRGR